MRLFIIAGEESGDIHASNMVRELKKLGDVELFGTGGSRLKELGQEQYFTSEEMAIIGFGEIIKRLPFIFRMFSVLEERVKEVRPDAVVLVDYPGFNLRFATKVKKLGIPVIYFIAPQVWAWHYSRVHRMKRDVDKVLCILPFEEEIFRKEGISATYVGNPIVDNIRVRCESAEAFRAELGLSADLPVIGVLPGSRRREIEGLMPVIREASLKWEGKAQFVLARAASVDPILLDGYIAGTDIRVVNGMTYDVMRHSDMLWCCSGTATLEAGICGTPMIILYTSGYLTKVIARAVAKTDYAGLPNIIAKKLVCPELLFEQFTPDMLSSQTEKEFARIDEVREELNRIREMFIGRNPSQIAAEEIFTLLSKR